MTSTRRPRTACGSVRRTGEAARTTVTEFVRKWMLGQERFKSAGDYQVRVFFADEPIEALGSAPPPFVKEQ